MVTNPVLNQIVVAVDVLIVVASKDNLEILLVKLKNEPYKDKWALPGSVVQEEESLDKAATRVVAERIGVSKVKLDQMYTFGEVKRDLRKRSISVAYLAMLDSREKIKPILKETYSEINWFLIDKLPEMAFDHKEIVKMARKKMAFMLDEKEVVAKLLPKKFTMSRLLQIHEIMSGKKIDKRNFVKKVKNENLLKDTGELQKEKANRPAKLYSFR